MTTPFEYCIICDGYGGNGAPCGGCKQDSGSPLRIVAEQKPKKSRWDEWLPHRVGRERFEWISRNTDPVCEDCDEKRFVDSKNRKIYKYCSLCGNAEVELF